MLTNGASIFAILEKIDMVCHQVYSPKGYSEVNYQKLFLFHKLEGIAVAELAHHILGLQLKPLSTMFVFSLSSHYQKFQHHLKWPTISFPPRPSPLSSTNSLIAATCVGFQLMADEIKIESRIRWDAWSNMILGVCREHLEVQDHGTA
jgi:hypothetical protein